MTKQKTLILIDGHALASGSFLHWREPLKTTDNQPLGLFMDFLKPF